MHCSDAVTALYQFSHARVNSFGVLGGDPKEKAYTELVQAFGCPI